VSPAAGDATAVYANNRAATTMALRVGAAGGPPVDETLAARGTPTNPYFATPS
jgi:5,6,7,8-tetrahydromethanopterin hydro-lyase